MKEGLSGEGYLRRRRKHKNKTSPSKRGKTSLKGENA